MQRTVQAAACILALAAAGQAAAQVTFYEGEGFRGQALTVTGETRNLNRAGFNDRASSVVVENGRWLACEHARFEGRCVVLRRGSYPSLRDVGMNNAISSVRPLEEGRRHGPPAHARGWREIEPVAIVPTPVPAPVPVPAPAPVYRVQPQEVIHHVPVTSVRAVVGPPNQRCWIERQQVTQPGQSNPNVGGAIIGGVVGGILGHQVGGGTGKDLATAGGAVAGAVIGSNVGSTPGAPQVVNRDVQRCENVANTKPEYWDVSYQWRGVEHRVQMTTPPGPTISVNDRGEPRL